MPKSKTRTPKFLPTAMAIFNFQILLYSLSVLFCFLFPETNSLTFNLPSIGPQDEDVNIKKFGDASFSTSGLQVTLDDRTTNESITDLKFLGGKATYVHKLHLWDKSTRFLADFDTHFVFLIASDGNQKFADGLTFFLAPEESSDITIGGAIGLPITTNATTSLPYDPDLNTSRFVAVEFDTSHNDWDPANTSGDPSTHVGIDVNSLKSIRTAPWHYNVTQAIQNEAWIRYNSSSYNLSVEFTDSTISNKTIHLIINLRDYLPEWVTFGFSAGTGSFFEKHTVKSWEFNSSVDPVKLGLPRVALVGIVVGSGVLVGGFVLVGFCLWRKSRANEEDEFEVEMSMENEFEFGSGPKKFSYGQLSRATNNFAEEQKLGEGGFGGVYRGFMRELNSDIAVKRISKGSEQGIKEYATEVKIISRLRHRNLVQLLGWCHEKKQLLLVYEFMENGSLDFHLFKGKSLLTWTTRYKIARGLASALLYLHEEWEQCVVHSDVKSSNVMLDTNFNVKLGDFGLAKFVDHGKEPETTLWLGSIGYLAPERVATGKSNKESDVYSFGVVALEIACGRKTIDLMVPESQMRLVEWVWDLYGMGRLLEAVDPKLGTDFDDPEMRRLMIVGLWCTQLDRHVRPKIRQAIHVLNFEAPLPILQPKQPALSVFSPPSSSSTSQSQYFTSSSTASPPSVSLLNKE